MYSMEKEDEAKREVKLPKTNVPCDTDQAFKWDRGVEMWKFWLGIEADTIETRIHLSDEDEDPLPGNGPVKV